MALATGTLMAVVEDVPSGLTMLGACGLAMTLIWFAEPLAHFVGRVGMRQIARPSPPGLVRAFGWIFLGVLAGASVARALQRL